MSPPLRFLAMTIAGWAGLRALTLVPEAVLPAEAIAEAPASVTERPRPAATQWVISVANMPRRTAAAAGHVWPKALPGAVAAAAPARQAVPDPPAILPVPIPAPRLWPEPAGIPLGPVPDRRGLDRWSVSTWLLVRNNSGSALASAGTLGGTQTGFRIGYRLSRPVSLSARFSSPLGNGRGAEAALGIDWRPLARIPLNLLAERRQAIGRDGRNAFALTLYGGLSGRLAGNFRVDAYAQGGIVGARSRDLFGDGSARLGVPIGGFELGASVSGGAQPGAARLDLGPQMTFRLPVAGERLRLTAEWRFRVAGEARPGSGPALTLASDF